MSGRRPPLCCTLTLIAMQGHQTKNSNRTVAVLFYVFGSHLLWTSSSLDVPAGVTQGEGHTRFLIHLPSAAHAFIFLARRIQPILTFVDREVAFCVLTVLSFSIRWAFSSTFLATHAFIFILCFSREGSSRSFPSSTVNSSSPLVVHFKSGKIPVTGIRTHVPASQKVARFPTEIPGRSTNLK